MSETRRPYHQPEFTHLEKPLLPPSGRVDVTSEQQFEELYPVRYRIWQNIETGRQTHNPLPEHLSRTLQMLNNLDNYVSMHMAQGKRVLREKQLAVFSDTHQFLEQGNTEGFIEAPTGFGKTVLFSEIIRATNQRTVVVVPSRILVEQTYESFKKFNPNLDCGRVYSDRKERGKQVTITTYQSLVQSNGGVEPSDTDLLILDEVHQSLTDHRIEAVSRFGNAIKLGFTATPEYSRDKRVANLLNNQIHSISLKEAVEAGLLSPFSVYLAETDVDISSVKVTAAGEYDERELEQAINIYSRNKSAVDLYQQMVDQDPGLAKAIAYCVTIKHAQEVARVFNEAGVPAAAIWSDQDIKERQGIIEAYKRGEIKILTNVNILTEGFDDPEAALCLNLRPTRSKVVAKQRGGRILRLDPNNRQKHAVIVDYLDRNDDKRNFQVTFAQIAMGDRDINATPIDIFTDQSGARRQASDEEIKDEKTDPQFMVKGLHVVTNSKEVLRIVSENAIEDEEYPPEGWKTRRKLAKELIIGDTVMSKTIERICEELGITDQNASEFFRVHLIKGRLSQYLSPEMIARIGKALITLKDFPGFIEVPSGELMKEFNIPQISYWRALRKLRKLHPEHFIQRGKSQKWFIDNDGHTVLRDYLSKSVERKITRRIHSPSVDHHYISAKEIGKEFGLSGLAIARRIKRIKDEDPASVIGGEGQPYFLTIDAQAKLRESLASRVTQPSLEEIGNRHIVSAKELQREYNRSFNFIRRRIRQVSALMPNGIIGGSRGMPFFFTDEAEKALRELLNERT